MDERSLNVVSVWAKNSNNRPHMLGTAFAICQGYLMTCRHVVLNKDTGKPRKGLFIRGNIFIGIPKEKVFVADTFLPESHEKTDHGEYLDDFAILKIDQSIGSNLFLNQHIVPPLNNFFIENYSEPIYHVSVRNENSDYARNTLEYQGDTTENGCWSFHQGVERGESGSPVFTKDGLIGIARARSGDKGEGRLYVTPCSRFEDFIKKTIPKKQTPKTIPGFNDKHIPKIFNLELKGLHPILAEKISEHEQVELDGIDPETMLLKLESLATQEPYEALICLYNALIEWGSEYLCNPKTANKAKLLALWVLVKGLESFIANHRIESQACEGQLSASMPKIIDADVLLAYFSNAVPGVSEVTRKGTRKRLRSVGAIDFSLNSSSNDSPESGRTTEAKAKDFLIDLRVSMLKREYKNTESVGIGADELKGEVTAESEMDMDDFVSTLNSDIKTERKTGGIHYFLVVNEEQHSSDVIRSVTDALEDLPVATIDAKQKVLLNSDLESVLIKIFDLISHAEG